MSRRSGYRFADKDMRQRKNLEHIPVHQDRDVLWTGSGTRHDDPARFAPVTDPALDQDLLAALTDLARACGILEPRARVAGVGCASAAARLL
jgi:hypothetical protein